MLPIPCGLKHYAAGLSWFTRRGSTIHKPPCLAQVEGIGNPLAKAFLRMEGWWHMEEQFTPKQTPAYNEEKKPKHQSQAVTVLH